MQKTKTMIICLYPTKHVYAYLKFIFCFKVILKFSSNYHKLLFRNDSYLKFYKYTKMSYILKKHYF